MSSIFRRGDHRPVAPPRRTISEEPVYDSESASSSSGFVAPSEEFTLEEEIVLPNVDELFPKKHPDPWNRMSALEHDCILVVEFSELEGPKPSFCIPESPGAHFERNDFSVWLMTADYQASNHRNGPFSINEDIQILLSNEEQGVQTYAHHFTLFDIEARGYVRPFCVTYVTPDWRKLDGIFDQLRREFTEILRAVKMCNRRLFRKALTEAAEALNVIETQAISGYYELYYDRKAKTTNLDSEDSDGSHPNNTPSSRSVHTSPSHISRQEKPDVLNLRYRRLQRELLLAQNVVSDDLRSKFTANQSTSSAPSADSNGGDCCGSHQVNMDQWINSMRRGEGCLSSETHKKTLKEFHQLCPCVFDEFQRRTRSIWMKYRHWNKAAEWILEPRSRYGAKLNIGSVPILYVPKTDDADDRTSRDGGASAIDLLQDDRSIESQSSTEGQSTSRTAIGRAKNRPNRLIARSTNRSIHNKGNRRKSRPSLDYSITEVDALHNLIYSKIYRSQSKDQNRLLLNVAQHLRYFLYPILTGQLLITYGSDLRRQLIIDLIQKLKLFVPCIFASPRCSVWNDAINGESVLGDYKLYGLKVGQKESIDDYLNEQSRRYAALLDLNNDTFHVADYRGDMLTKLIARIPGHRSDWTLITTTILSIFSEYALSAYVYAHADTNFKKLTNSADTSKSKGGKNGFFKNWGGKNGTSTADGILKMQSGDLRIVKYFVELLKMQKGDGDRSEDEEENEDGFLLEYEPASLHKM